MVLLSVILAITNVITPLMFISCPLLREACNNKETVKKVTMSPGGGGWGVGNPVTRVSDMSAGGGVDLIL